MAQDSKIEWTHHTLNLWSGCTKVHEGCDNCYAEKLSHRWGNDVWGNDKPRKVVKKAFADLAKFQKLAAAAGEVHRVFVGSMMDIFEKSMPLIDHNGSWVTWGDDDDEQLETGHLRARLFREIGQGKYPNIMFLLLTKRPSNINKYIPWEWHDKAPENVMFGTSPVNQQTFDTLTAQLLKVNGKRFLSMEPQLDFIKLENRLSHSDLQGINWIIQGGESGHGRRAFDLEWAYSMKDQCFLNGINYFFKQIDKVLPVPENLMIREFPLQHSIAVI